MSSAVRMLESCIIATNHKDKCCFHKNLLFLFLVLFFSPHSVHSHSRIMTLSFYRDIRSYAYFTTMRVCVITISHILFNEMFHGSFMSREIWLLFMVFTRNPKDRLPVETPSSNVSQLCFMPLMYTYHREIQRIRCVCNHYYHYYGHIKATTNNYIQSRAKVWLSVPCARHFRMEENCRKCSWMSRKKT